ncbi:MAG TPA: hypothetical protein VN958_04840, partial [Chitinophagaceae bacterium]|nr:hypothetical protein [Chitinophagaceae bacterium]
IWKYSADNSWVLTTAAVKDDGLFGNFRYIFIFGTRRENRKGKIQSESQWIYLFFSHYCR